MRLPAHCPSCEAVFLSAAYEFSGNVTAWNNSERCIRCGQRAYLSEGVFRISGDLVEAISVTPRTIENFNQLAALAGAVKSGHLSADDAIEKAEEISPGFGKLFATWIANNWIALAALVLTAYQLIDAKHDEESTAQRMERLISSVERLNAPPKPSAQHSAQHAQRKNRHARRAEQAQNRKATKPR